MAGTVGGYLRSHAGPLVAAVAALVVAGVGVAAALQPGFPQHPPTPQNRSMWVVNSGQSLVGRVNPAAAELDSAVEVRGTVELLRDPVTATAIIVDRGGHELQLVDRGAVAIGTRIALPTDASVQVGGGVIAVADRDDGRIWTAPVTAPGSLDPATTKELAVVGAGAVVAVTDGGVGYAIAPGSDRFTVVAPDGTVSTVPLPGGPLSSGNIQLTTVGAIPVLLDPTGNTVRTDQLSIPVTVGVGALLQLSGPDTGAVLIGTGTAVLRVDLTDSSVTQVAAGSGTPANPVDAGGCAYGLWTGDTAQAVVACPGADPAVHVFDGGLDSAHLVANDADVLVSSPGDGRSWLASDGFTPIDNWADVAPPDQADPNRTDTSNELDSERTPPPPPNCANVPIGDPKAADDERAIRAGRTSVLRVLDNDPTVDCTAVLVSSVTALPPELGTVTIVDGGRALQVTVPASASGSLPPLEYTVDNGLGATATAKVALRVAPPGETSAPVRLRRPAVEVEAGATVGYNVLLDYRSPTGDDLYLVSADTSDGDEVAFRPDGTLTYRSVGTGAGSTRSVAFVVSDGHDQVSGVLRVSIAAPGSTTPVSYPSVVRGQVGLPATVDVTRTLTSGSADPVVISQVTPVGTAGNATVGVDSSGHKITVQADAPGSYYFTFQISAGGNATSGVLRADIAASSARGAVVPMLDLAYLPVGGTVIVDPLANDLDPTGRGLAVRSIPQVSKVTVTVRDLHLVTVTAPRSLTEPVALAYTVFDGVESATGEIRVIPVPAARQTPPPLTTPIAVKVRAGDAVTIPVATYAVSQDGSPVTAVVDAAETAALPGVAFSTGTSIRYLAPDVAPDRPVRFGYTALAATSTDEQPVRASSTVSITVLPANPDDDHAPHSPDPLVARVFAGSTISVDLPLAGIDPDGDWVTATSLVPPAQPLGKAVLEGSGSLRYTALAAPGIDRIEYLVADPAGNTSSGVVTVLVVPPAATAGPPIAPDLIASVKPGATIRLDPLDSVIDPAGSAVTLGEPAFVAVAGLSVVVDDGGLLITAPTTETVVAVQYTVINAKKLSATGAIRLTVTATAPTPPPLARDVFVPPTDLGDGADHVDVDVAGQITNRTGSRDSLTVAVDPLSASAATMASPTVVRVQVADHRQVIAYRITDTVGGVATAFIVLPPREQLVGPQLIAGKDPIRVDAGTAVQIRLAEYVIVAGGEPTLATGQPIRATQGTATALSSTVVELAEDTKAGGAAVLYVPIDNGAGAVVVLGLAVQIIPRDVPPPRLSGLELPVEVGTSVTLDLAPLTTSFDQIQASTVSYTLEVTNQNGIRVELTGSTLTASVDLTTPRDTSLGFAVTVADGDGNASTAQFLARAAGSTKPLPVVLAQHLTIRAGEAVTTDLLLGSTDPVGKGLTVQNLQVTEGAAGITSGPSLSAGTVQLGTGGGFTGDILLTFDVADGTQDPLRVVTGTLQVTIQDRPSQPGAPTLVPGSRTPTSVQLAFSAANANGSALTGYTVLAGSRSWTCSATANVCQIDGLVTGQSYVFTVIATNLIGQSDPSAPSEAIVADAVPDAPGPPAAEYAGRGTILVSWSVPSGAFSPVTGMTVRVLAGGSVISEIPVGLTSAYTAEGLDPAQGYTFQVRAGNQEGASDWSPLSSGVQPSGVPSEPTGVAGSYLYDGSSQQVALSWGPPADNGGAAVQGYVIRNPAGEVVGTPGSGDGSITLPVGGAGGQTFSITASNDRGEGPAASTSVQVFLRPSQVTGLTAAAAGDGALALTWNPADSPGSAIAGYQYQLGGGAWTAAGAATSTTVTGLTNGTAVTVKVRACNTATGYPETATCGDASATASATPYGPLAAPTVTLPTPTPTDLTVTAGWTFPDGNGRPVDTTSVTITVNGAAGSGVNVGAGTWSSSVPSGATVVVTAKICVSGPAQCQETTKTTRAPVSYTVAAPGAMLGVCATPAQVAGDWIAQAACAAAGGTWVADGAVVMASCADNNGLQYWRDPGSANPKLNDWIRAADGGWYRTPAVTTTGSAPPAC